VQFVTRKSWGAAAPKAAFTKLDSHQLLGMAVHYEDGPFVGHHNQCDDTIRSVQAFHQRTRGWNDIAYNWLVCGHGVIYEGRGWLHRSAAQGTEEGNRAYHAVCALAGANSVHDFTPEQKHGLYEVIVEGQALGYGHEVRPHSSFHPTSCPGDAIRGWVLAGHPYADAPPVPSSKPPVTGPGNGPGAIHVSPGGGGLVAHSHPGFPPFVVELKVRTAGHAVTVWQRQMAHRGWRIAVDGLYGLKSAGVCQRFQHEAGLKVAQPGVVDRLTWEQSFIRPIGGGRGPIASARMDGVALENRGVRP
jgi:hypothetical protein